NLCKKLGITSERCQELRKECKECFNSLLDGAVATLAEMIENDPKDALKKELQLSDKQKELILSVAEQMKEEGKSILDLDLHGIKGKESKVDEKITSLETVAANAAMILAKEPGKPDETGKPRNFWQRLVDKAKQPKQAKKKEDPDDRHARDEE